MTRFLLLLCAAFLLAGCGAKGVTVVDKSGFVTMSQRMPQEMKARGLLTDDGSYIFLPGGGGENYGEILFRQLSPEFLFNDRGHVYLGSTFAATRARRPAMPPYARPATIVHPTQTINLAMPGIVDWNNDEKDEWLICRRVRPHLGSESRTCNVCWCRRRCVRASPCRPLAAVYECYGWPASSPCATVAPSPRERGELPPRTYLMPARHGRRDRASSPASTPRSGLQERSL